MNIVVLTAAGNVTVRPDTTWEKDNEDFYVPEHVGSLKFSPVLFARISKPGRSISEKFASRYFDAISYGLFLYPTELLNVPEQGWACASCMDHTSFLPHPLFNPITLSAEHNSFQLKKNREQIFLHPADSVQKIEHAIKAVSQICYLRTGDFVAVELGTPKNLSSREDGEETLIEGYYCENKTIDFKIIY